MEKKRVLNTSLFVFTLKTKVGGHSDMCYLYITLSSSQEQLLRVKDLGIEQGC